MNVISSIDACIASVCSGLQLSLNDVVFAADLWNLTLDSTATHDWPMGPGTPPYFLAQLVWGSVFLEYLSHFSLIPSRLTNAISSAYERHLRKPQNASFPNQYLQELGGETTASPSSAIYMADSSSTLNSQNEFVDTQRYFTQIWLRKSQVHCFERYLLVKGVNHVNVPVTVPRGEHHNIGVAEKAIQDLSNMMRCMLANSNVPNIYWDFVIEHAALVNFMITPSISDKTKTIFEAVWDAIPNIDPVPPVGCFCARLMDNSAREDWKLDPKNQSGVFLSVLLTGETCMVLKF
jgi:hypothetical protein